MSVRSRAGLAVFAVVLVAIQLVPVERSNPPVEADFEQPADVKRVLQESCYDCHSNETHWPWYSRVAPISWLVAWDVKEAREELNFSSWSRLDAEERREKMEEIWEEVDEGKMPLWFYPPLHPEARLTVEDLDALRSWSSGGPQGDEQRSDDPDRAAAAEDDARVAASAVAALRQALGGALREALAEVGPEGAIEVCRVEAPRLSRLAAPEGVSVGRTSHRLRNPANAPEAWMLPFLDAYRGEGADAAGPRTVDLGPRGTGYVEPIPMQPLCVTCHGENVAPGLLAAIRARYPEDRAVGFREGELRGLFWAVVSRASE